MFYLGGDVRLLFLHYFFSSAVFRTNVAYQRWDEARKAWEVVMNHSRNLMRQGASLVTEDTEPDPELRRQALTFFCNSVWAFSRSMQRHLWGVSQG